MPGAKTEQKQTRTTQDVDAPQQAAQPDAAAAKSAYKSAIATAIGELVFLGVALAVSSPTGCALVCPRLDRAREVDLLYDMRTVDL